MSYCEHIELTPLCKARRAFVVFSSCERGHANRVCGRARHSLRVIRLHAPQKKKTKSDKDEKLE